MSLQPWSVSGSRSRRRRPCRCCYPICPCCSRATAKPSVNTWTCCRRSWATPSRAACSWRRVASCCPTPSSTPPPPSTTATLWPCGSITWRSTCPRGRLRTITPGRAPTSGPAPPRPWSRRTDRTDTWRSLGRAEWPHRSTAAQVTPPAWTSLCVCVCPWSTGISVAIANNTLYGSQL